MQVQRRLLLDEFELAKAAAAGDPEANIAPIMINDDPDISFRSPYEFIYARYDRAQNLQVRVGISIPPSSRGVTRARARNTDSTSSPAYAYSAVSRLRCVPPAFERKRQTAFAGQSVFVTVAYPIRFGLGAEREGRREGVFISFVLLASVI